LRYLQAVGGTALSQATPEKDDVADVPAIGQERAVAAGVPASRSRALALLGVAAAVVVLADQITKHLTVARLTDRPPVRLLGGAVYLVEVRNSGAAFSLGSGYTFAFPLITVAVVGWIGWMALRLRSLPWAVSLGLVLGGALGNLTDRIFRSPGPFVGHVVDMISLFDDHGGHWPVFNLADSSLVAGVLLAVLLELTGRRRDGTRAVAG
jgi:signal peptidase II